MNCINCGQELDLTEMNNSPTTLDQGGDGSQGVNFIGPCPRCGNTNSHSLYDIRNNQELFTSDSS